MPGPLPAQLACSLFDHKRDNRPRGLTLTFEALRARLEQHTERKAKDGPLWSPASYPEGATRKNADVESLSALVVEFDNGVPPDEVLPKIARYAYSVHTTFSHTDEAWRWRLVIPFAEPVPAAEWPDTYRRLVNGLFDGQTDPVCKGAAWMFYLPSCLPGAPRRAWSQTGLALVPADFLDAPAASVEKLTYRAATPDGSRPPMVLLIEQARGMEGQVGREPAGLHLFCQLRDNDYSEQEAQAAVTEWVAGCGPLNTKGEREPYTQGEARHSLAQAYSRPKREPWGRAEHVTVFSSNGQASVAVEEEDYTLAGLADEESEGTSGGPSELTLARGWGKKVLGHYAFFDGAQWWEYGKGRWRHSSTDIIETDIQRYMEARRRKEPKLSITAAKLANIRNLARPYLGVHQINELNAHPTWVPLTNGVYDTESGKLLPHSPDHMLSQQLPFAFSKDAECPRWLKFLDEVMLTTDGKRCEEWITALQEWFGYCLVPDVSAQVSMVWVGEGQNGKGVATRVLQELVGRGQACPIPIEQLHDPYHRAELHGKLVGLVNEPDPRAMVKNGSYFKALTGGDDLSARRPGEKVFSFTPTCRIVISCNTVPSTRDLSHGYFRRLVLIEWRYRADDTTKDTALDEKLRAELPGIFNWSLEGLRRFRERGYRFAPLPESDRLLGEYKLSEDPLAQFIESECERGPEFETPAGPFYEAYVRWCGANGWKTHLTSTKVGRQLEQMGLKGGQVWRGGTVRLRFGIRFREDSPYNPLAPKDDQLF